MYDGLSRDDLKVILAHQEYISAINKGYFSMVGNGSIALCLQAADGFLGLVEALNTEPEPREQSERRDGEGEGARACSTE